MLKHLYHVLCAIAIGLECQATQTTMPSYSLTDSAGIPLDHQLIEIMNFKKNGTFIEVGAFDGISQSNTKLLEEMYSWTGILIEPSESLFSTLCANRPYSKCFQCALGSPQQNNTYAYGDFYGHTMSSFTGRRGSSTKTQVYIRSLQSILDECNITHIDFFSLDTEGYELPILQGIDFKKTIIEYILVEIYTADYTKITTLLTNNGYILVKCLSNYNKKDTPLWDGTHNDYLFKKVH